MKSTHKTRKAASAEAIARLADRGQDVSRFFTNKGQMMSPIQRVNLDLAPGMLEELDKAAEEMNISRQAVIKTLIRQALDQAGGAIIADLQPALDIAGRSLAVAGHDLHRLLIEIATLRAAHRGRIEDRIAVRICRGEIRFVVFVGLAERLGLPEGRVDELDVGSPFDYRSHALLYVARSLPDRRSPEAEPALHDELEMLITAAGGRTLALFTSWRAMRAAVEALRERLDVPVLAQSDLPKPALVEAFRADEATCLFATLGYWQGVDVPGRTLSLVTIDRIPFPRPDEPVLEARRERAGSGAFSLVDLPRAGTLLAQGAGRLIRSANDRGVVAVLDSRLATARYRGALLARVPPMKRTLDRADVVAFLEGIRDEV